MVLPALLAGSLRLAIDATASAPDAAFDAPLQALYDGSTDKACEQLAAVAAAYPADPLPPYFQALALAWKLEGMVTARCFHGRTTCPFCPSADSRARHLPRRCDSCGRQARTGLCRRCSRFGFVPLALFDRRTA